MNVEYYSSAALVTSVVVYLLAMTAHAAEWAAARRTPVEAEMADGGRADVELADAKLADAELVGARASTTATGTQGTPAAEDRTARRASDDADRRMADVKVDLWGRVGVALTVIGFACSAVGVVGRGLAAGRPPWGNMFEFTITAMLLIVAGYLVMVWRTGARWLGLPVTLLAAVGNGLAITVFYVAVAPLVPALHSVWFVIHIIAAAISGAAFNIGAVLTVLFLLRQRAERRGSVHGYLSRVPSARRLDLYAYRFHAFAFPLWTFTVAAGAIWAEYAWGRYWGWDPKETWALVTWVVYACYLHARSTAGWRGTRAAVIALIGVASFWFNFVGINLLVSGLHSYAGI